MANYLRAITMEVTALARACGKSDVHHLEPEDLVALTVEAAAMARVPLAGTTWIPGLAHPTTPCTAPRSGRRRGHRWRGGRALSTARALVELGVTRRARARARTPSARAAAASPAASCAATTASRRWPPWPGAPCRCWRTRPRCSAPTRATAAPATWSASGRENLGALRANVAMQQRLGIEVELVGHDDAPRLWPGARLDDFAEFAYEPRGGYGDGHQTALAFAARPAAAGPAAPALRAWPGWTCDGDAVAGVRLADGSRIGAAQVVAGRRAVVGRLAAAVGVDLPIRAQRAQILLVDPGATSDRCPVFSDLVSLQYVRTEGTRHPGRRQRPLRPEWADPD